MGAAATPLAIGAANAGIGVAGAVAQNRAVNRSADAARGATDVELDQLGDSASLELRKRQAESQAIRARMRVLQADSGLGFTGSFDALERQIDIDEQINRSIIDQNLYNQRRRSISELSARLAGLAGQTSNPLISGIQGGLGGYQTGLQIQGALDSMAPEPSTTKVELYE